MDKIDTSTIVRLRAWAELIRLPLVFAMAADVLAGTIIAGADWARLSVIVSLLVASGAFWAAAGTIGDWFTWKRDIERRPQRPIPTKRINRWHALSVGVVLMAIGVTLAGAPGPLLTSKVALLLVATIMLGRVMLRHVPAAIILEILYRPFNFLMGLAIVPLTFSPAYGELRFYLLLSVGLYATTLVLLDEYEIHAYHARRLAAIAVPSLVAIIAVASLPVLFAGAGPSWIGMIWIGLMVAFTGYRLSQMILSPNGTTVSRASQAVGLGGILLAAAATAFTHHPWASLLVAGMLVPAGWSMYYLNTPRRKRSAAN